MKDPRFEKLAQVILGHSTKLQKGEKILIEAIDVPAEMAVALLRGAEKIGAILFPFPVLIRTAIPKEIKR